MTPQATELLLSPWMLALLGLLIGSFLNVVIYRLPRMVARDFAPQGYARQLRKDLEMVREFAAALGTPVPMLQQALQEMRENQRFVMTQALDLRDKGIRPVFPINHGPTTSMYYADPDGNQIELQVDNFPSMDECKAWFTSPEFAANPIGVDFDPAALMEKLRAGQPISELVKQGAAPVAPDKAYRFTTLPPPPGA